MFHGLRNLLLRRINLSIQIKTMSTCARYFMNLKPDYDTDFGAPHIPEKLLESNIKFIITKIENYVKPVERNAGDGLYLGTAGIAYMFYHLSKLPMASGENVAYLNKAMKYLEPALVVAMYSTGNRKDVPSFYLGNAGIYAIAAAIYKAVGDQSQCNHYRQLYYEAAEICKETAFLNCGSDELFVGRAGYILGALWLSNETKTPINRKELYELCRIIVKSGREYSQRHHSPCPLMYSYYQVEYLGAAHGLSSILQVLISVPGYMDANPKDAADIKTTIDYLLSLQNDDGNFPAAMDEVGHKSELVHWCHGAAGMVYLMAKAFLIFKEQKYRRSCKRMADLIWDQGLLKKGPGLCHGVTGNGYVFLLMYRLTRGEPKYLYRALRFYEFMETDEFQASARIPDHPYSLFEGLAGTACYLGDLTYPLGAAFPFSDIFSFC